MSINYIMAVCGSLLLAEPLPPAAVNQTAITDQQSDFIENTNYDVVAADGMTGEMSGIEAALSPAEEAELMAALASDQPVAENGESPKSAAAKNGGKVFDLAISLTGDFALAWFSAENMQSGAHDPHEDGFNLQQLELTLGAAVDHVFRMDANLVFSLSGVELEEAYVTTLGLPANFQIRAGQFLSRIGRLNATHPHSWDFVDQPFVIGKFYGAEGNRGLGLEVSWLSPLPWYLEVVASAQMSTSSASNRSFLDKENKITGLKDLLYTAAIKQFFPLGRQVGLFWGLSAQFGANNTGFDNRTNIFATDLHLKYSPAKYPEMFLVFQSEIFVRERQVPGNLLLDVAGYAQVVWQITKKWGTGIRGEYGSGVADDYLDPEWTEGRSRASWQITWSPSHFSRIRGQAAVDMPKWRDKPIYALFLTLEFSAGTHPAHSY